MMASFVILPWEMLTLVCFQSSQWLGKGTLCVFQLKGHITPVRTLAFSPDGMALASGGVGGLMNIWSLRVSGPMGAAHVYTGELKGTSDSSCVCLCVCQDGSVLQSLVAGSGAIQNTVWIPDVGVAVCSNRSKVRLLSLAFSSAAHIVYTAVVFVRNCGGAPCRAGRAGGELLQGVHGVQSRAVHVPHCTEEAGGGRPQHGALHEGLPGETACHAAGAVRLREGAHTNNVAHHGDTELSQSFENRMTHKTQEGDATSSCNFLLQPHVVCGEQLVHSPYMQCLASLAVGLHLDQLLCRPPVPPSLRHCPPESGTAVWCASEWAWLDCFSTTVKAAEALARGATFPESFSVPDLEPVAKDEMALLMVSKPRTPLPLLSSSAVICVVSLLGSAWGLLCRTTVSGPPGWMSRSCPGPRPDQR